MRIEVVPTVEEIRHDQISGRTVVVIDVLRAASTIITALHHGFDYVVPVETIGQAQALKTDRAVLAGERLCKNIAEFDLNNSPTQILAADPRNRFLILTTTNGTKAIHRAERAEKILIGCFLNAAACAKEALSSRSDITLYCAGSRRRFALEDGLAAGLIIHHLRTFSPRISCDDLGELLEASYLKLANELLPRLMNGTTGKRLQQHRFHEDIRHCCQVDCYGIAAYVQEKRILATPVS